MRNKPDWILILTFLLLTAIGWVSIFFTQYLPGNFTMDSGYGMQLIWIASLWIIGLLVYIINHRFYYNYSAYIYILFNILVVLVLFVGVERSGAKSWLGIGGFGIQPAEFAKYGTCLCIARYLSSSDCDLTKWKNVMEAGIIILIPVALILLQNDTGTALPFFFLVFTLFREGLTPWVLIIGFLSILLFALLIYFSHWTVLIAASAVFVGLRIYFYKKGIKKYIKQLLIAYVSVVLFIFSADTFYHKVLKEHQRQRIELLFGRIDDPRGIGYNVNQAKIAIGSGGLSGKGFGEGTQTKLNFVPEQSTDFIFCTIGEEHGFVGTALVIFMYALLIGRIVYLSEKSSDTFVRTYGYGIASIFFAHATINIGMTIGLMPVIGIPLPFISYGGSSLWAFTLMLFTFINLQAKTPR
ncbi:MAG: rod shape-determining protein RodA [Bacteroidales bacterium]|jgi:rod shape determining protein RodA|nr:rod shape-determining protein RodA [Bacteroidales bacterium]